MPDSSEFERTLAGVRAQASALLQDELAVEDEAAKNLLAGATGAAQLEALVSIVSGEPIPTTVADQRALRLRYVCQAAGRFLTPHEVAILLRVSGETAVSLLKRVQTTYGLSLDEELTAHMRTSATPRDAKGEQYEVTFDDASALAFAVRFLARRRVTHGLSVNRARLRLTINRQVLAVVDGESGHHDVCDLLGIDQPEAQ